MIPHAADRSESKKERRKRGGKDERTRRESEGGKLEETFLL